MGAVRPQDGEASGLVPKVLHTVIAVFYLAFVLTTAAAMRRFEDRTAIPGLN